MTLLDNITAVVPEDEGGAAYANALKNVDYVVHAVPVQQSREFLSGIKVRGTGATLPQRLFDMCHQVGSPGVITLACTFHQLMRVEGKLLG
jgi:hypothetical protein